MAARIGKGFEIKDGKIMAKPVHRSVSDKIKSVKSKTVPKIVRVKRGSRRR